LNFFNDYSLVITQTEKKQRDAKRASKSGTAAASATDEAELASERRRKKNIANQQEFDNMIMVSTITKAVLRYH
jgi:hypothetical protein